MKIVNAYLYKKVIHNFSENYYSNLKKYIGLNYTICAIFQSTKDVILYETFEKFCLISIFRDKLLVKTNHYHYTQYQKVSQTE